MASQYKYTVCIHCMTYNHEKYLADALEGFVMQKTNFPFVAVVIDDFSTDGAADVLRKYEAKYPDIIKAVYLQENYRSQHKSKQPYMDPYDSQSKYIALCEGDDYWTDPYKLQKQIDFLENHKEYGACCHRFIEYYQDTKMFSKTDHWEGAVPPNGLELNSQNYFAYGRLPQYLTLVYRKDLLKDSFYYKITPRSQYDQTLFYAMAKLSKIWIMNEFMGVYRRHSGGVATSIYGTIEASEKQYHTWKDTYEVYPTEEVFEMYKGMLCTYVYQYIKKAPQFSFKFCYTLIKEYLQLCKKKADKMAMLYKIIKGFLLRILKR